MKRLFALFLLLLLLTGCSAGANGGTPTAVDAETFNTGVGQSTCAVTVTVNPQIKIFLDDARNVTAIQCVNEDAKTLFGGISPSGDAWGDTFDTYSGPIQGGTIGVG